MERLWGVCNTPLPCYQKTYWLFEISCKGVLHTPHRTPSQGWRMRKTRHVFYFHHVPDHLPRPRQRPWFSFVFFSCIKTRKEGRGMGAKPLIFISQDQYIQKACRVLGLLDRYIRKMNRIPIIHWVWMPKTWCIWGLLDPYTPKTYHVSCIHHH